MKKALICGVTGQDGAYLSKLLVDKGYEVYGASRDAQAASFANLAATGVRERVRTTSISVTDFRSVLQALERIRPDEVYNLAGQSSVGLSFEQPVETLESISLGTLNLLEAIRFTGRPIRLYSAGSGECYGNCEQPANEGTPFRPRSPYAVAKAAAFWEVANYREAYGLYACTGILFNHESPLRPERFVTRKIVAAAARIARGSKEKLRLGNVHILRDWGWAPDYVDAMWRMLQQPNAEDFVVATGASHSLEHFVDLAFREAGLQWRDHVVIDESLYRPTDLDFGRADPAKAAKAMGWTARHGLADVVRMMVGAERGGGRPV
jgi:GDPmannose 4,6-dehydratase